MQNTHKENDIKDEIDAKNKIEDDYDQLEISIEEINYDDYFGTKGKELYVASSGGGGHKEAIKAIQSYCDQNSLPKHKSIAYSDKKTTASGSLIRFFGVISEASLIKSTPDEINVLHFPIKDNRLMEGIRKLNKTESRTFVDFILDVHKDGYEEISLYNQLQQNDHLLLNYIVAFQALDNWMNYKNVVGFFFEKLTVANVNDHQPYSKIILTQPIGIKAICDAAFQYNNCMRAQNTKHQNIMIDLFITDLPTIGATHFFNPLENLTEDMKKLVNIHAVSLNIEVLKHFFKKNYIEIMDFNAIYSISPTNNPMVHPAFKANDDIPESTDWTLQTLHQNYQIDAHDRIAAIMLGSQGSMIVADYIEILFDNNIDKIFVLGVKDTEIEKKINQLLLKSPNKDKCILLDFENPYVVAKLIRKSMVFICGCGGLTIMQLLAELRSEQKQQNAVLLSYNDLSRSKTGWEEGNGDELIRASCGTKTTVLKTSVTVMSEQLKSLDFLQIQGAKMGYK